MNTRLMLALGLVALSAPVLADNLNTVIIPSGVFIKHSSSVESGSRLGARVEFANLGKNVALDLRYTHGLDYPSYGSSLKFFAHEQFSSSIAGSLGGGPLIDYSTGYTNLSDASRQAFIDVGGELFARGFWDTGGSGVGIMLEVGLDLMFQRHTLEKDTLPYQQNHDLRYRPYIALGVPFEI